MMIKVASILLLIPLLGPATAQAPCAFNANCQCQGQGPSYSQVSCTSATTFPKFNVPQGITVQKFLISGTFDSVPATGLDQFTKIDDLTLEHTGSGGAVKIKIENDAEYMLVNTVIGRLTLSGFTGLLPLNDPGAFYGAGIDKTTLARLTGLTIKQPNLEFQKDSFLNATSLKQLILRDDGIVDGNPKARQFVDIKSTLTDLDLGHNHLTNYASWKLSLEELTKLEILRLDHNKLQNLNGANFSVFPALRVLDLSANALSNFGSSNFPIQHLQLEELYLNENKLDQFPRDALLNLAKTLTTLDLTNNRIQKLSPLDLPFTLGNHLTSLNLNGNPIQEVDAGTFKELHALYKFTVENWALETLDLSVFGIDQNGIGYLDVWNNSKLSNIKLSNENSIPVGLNQLLISGNRLQSIDRSIATLFRRSEFHLIISNETHFECPYEQSSSLVVSATASPRPSQELTWLAKSSICDRQVTIADNVFCRPPIGSNSAAMIPLNHYLRSFELNCDSAAFKGSTTGSPHGTTTDEVSAPVTYSFYGYLQGYISFSKFPFRLPQGLFGKVEVSDE